MRIDRVTDLAFSASPLMRKGVIENALPNRENAEKAGRRRASWKRGSPPCRPRFRTEAARAKRGGHCLLHRPLRRLRADAAKGDRVGHQAGRLCGRLCSAILQSRHSSIGKPAFFAALAVGANQRELSWSRRKLAFAEDIGMLTARENAAGPPNSAITWEKVLSIPIGYTARPIRSTPNVANDPAFMDHG